MKLNQFFVRAVCLVLRDGRVKGAPGRRVESALIGFPRHQRPTAITVTQRQDASAKGRLRTPRQVGFFMVGGCCLLIEIQPRVACPAFAFDPQNKGANRGRGLPHRHHEYRKSPLTAGQNHRLPRLPSSARIDREQVQGQFMFLAGRLPRSGYTPKPRVAERTLGNRKGYQGIRRRRYTTGKRIGSRLYNAFGVNVWHASAIPGCAAQPRPWASEFNAFGVKRFGNHGTLCGLQRAWTHWRLSTSGVMYFVLPRP
jgi:hypothetical protein